MFKSATRNNVKVKEQLEIGYDVIADGTPFGWSCKRTARKSYSVLGLSLDDARAVAESRIRKYTRRYYVPLQTPGTPVENVLVTMMTSDVKYRHEAGPCYTVEIKVEEKDEKFVTSYDMPDGATVFADVNASRDYDENIGTASGTVEIVGASLDTSTGDATISVRMSLDDSVSWVLMRYANHGMWDSVHAESRGGVRTFDLTVHDSQYGDLFKIVFGSDETPEFELRRP